MRNEVASRIFVVDARLSWTGTAGFCWRDNGATAVIVTDGVRSKNTIKTYEQLVVWEWFHMKYKEKREIWGYTWSVNFMELLLRLGYKLEVKWRQRLNRWKIKCCTLNRTDIPTAKPPTFCMLAFSEILSKSKIFFSRGRETQNRFLTVVVKGRRDGLTNSEPFLFLLWHLLIFLSSL